MMENGLEQLIAECAEAMFDEDLELCEARDFTMLPDGLHFEPREDGFAVVSGARANKETPYGKVIIGPDGKPIRNTNDSRIAMNNRLGRALEQLGYAFRKTRGGFRENAKSNPVGEYGFIVYPYKYDKDTGERVGGVLTEMPIEDKTRAFDEFAREIRRLGRAFKQEAVLIVKPKWLSGQRFYDTGTRMRTDDRIGYLPAFRKRRNAVKDNVMSFDTARQTTLEEPYFTNFKGRTDRHDNDWPEIGLRMREREEGALGTRRSLRKAVSFDKVRH